ncbi:MAG: hypothetical protein V7K98_21040 [Nostoc sp.]|uniref:hypothetical protein n=1 Tax=Nostoc sp. TaxID=1180 RepID=UPI002FF67CEB
MKKNSEVRIQESESISRGFRSATELLHHQIFNLVGGLKPSYSSATRTEFILLADSYGLAHSDC